MMARLSASTLHPVMPRRCNACWDRIARIGVAPGQTESNAHQNGGNHPGRFAHEVGFPLRNRVARTRLHGAAAATADVRAGLAAARAVIAPETAAS
jgi:hypothetical protein